MSFQGLLFNAYIILLLVSCFKLCILIYLSSYLSIYLFIYLSIHILKSPISLNAIYAAVGNQNKSKIIDTGIVI